MAQGAVKHLGRLRLLVVPPTSSARQQFLCSPSEDAFGGPCHAVPARWQLPGRRRGCASCPVPPAPCWQNRLADGQSQRSGHPGVMCRGLKRPAAAAALQLRPLSRCLLTRIN